jgi:L-ascorbate metabolism protein UlaG (beta-lactamase superfamily)
MKRWYRHGKALLDEIALSRPQNGELLIWFAGQHGFIIKTGGLVFYIDVILNDLTDKEGNTRREYPPPFEASAVQKVDYVLCTHNHGDHLNLKTLLPLAEANPGARFVVPAPCKGVLTGAGIGEERVLAAKAGESIECSDESGTKPVSIIPVPAIHTRYIQDEGEKDANGDYSSLGFVLRADGLLLYHSGYTWITPPLVKALKALAPFDSAMLPINGTDWERTAENCIGNVSYLDAVKLARALPVDTVIPSHYDMMANNSENPARFVDSMYSLCPEKRFHILALGERFIYRKL